MKKFLLAISLISVCFISEAQLRNGNFELHNAIPAMLGDQQALAHWNNAQSSISTVDYYRSDAGMCCDWPETPFGMVSAHSQNSFVGLALCGTANSSNRAYLQQTFESPLSAGKNTKYLFIFPMVFQQQLAQVDWPQVIWVFIFLKVQFNKPKIGRFYSNHNSKLTPSGILRNGKKFPLCLRQIQMCSV